MDDRYTQRSIAGFRIGRNRITAEEFINTLDGEEIENTHLIYRGIDVGASVVDRKATRIYSVNVGNEIMSNVITPPTITDTDFVLIRVLNNIVTSETKPYMTQTGWINTMIPRGSNIIEEADYMPFVNHYVQLINAKRPNDVVDAMRVMENLAVMMNGVETHGVVGYDVILSDEFTELRTLARDIAAWNWIAFLVDLTRNTGEARYEFIKKYESELQCLMLICLINDSKSIKHIRGEGKARVKLSEFNHLRDGLRTKTFTYSRSEYQLMAKFWQLTFKLIDEVVVREENVAGRIRFLHSTENKEYNNKKLLQVSKPIRKIHEVLAMSTDDYSHTERLEYVRKLREISVGMHTMNEIDYKKNEELYEKLRERISAEEDKLER
ncbi:Cypovirus VP8 [Hubei lepidoptera virus 3]|uniref:Cypovirus VP8 n=1 Tax=Hubei lepidoptera virus 3 TaxID=1922905 RepID=UPI00090BA915|nr:Cypovirus VP8 [Hubei lepidoptera virus 3]APG79100.1 Cypovirus VP8 [Hubei lepidoptera virus 3]